MQRYFVNNQKDIFTLSSNDSYHISKVMRMQIDDLIEVVSDKKVYVARIIELVPVVRAKMVRELEEDSNKKFSVTIAQALVKEQKMDYILQKTTELGVDELIPITVERSIIKVNQKEDKKIDRWYKIMKEAAEQSKRNEIPRLTNITSLSNLVNLSEYDMKFLCTVNEKSQNIKKVLSNLNGNVRMLFVIGPEGGFARWEEELLMENGFIAISLGDSVLRTETASTFIMSVIRYLDMG